MEQQRNTDRKDSTQNAPLLTALLNTLRPTISRTEKSHTVPLAQEPHHQRTRMEAIHHRPKHSVSQPIYHISISLDRGVDSVISLDQFEDDSLLAGPSSSSKSSDQTDYRLSNITIMSAAVSEPRGKSAVEPIKARYMGYGVVRLYREYPSELGTKKNDSDVDSGEIEVNSDDTTVAIVAIPNYFSPTDVLGFIGEAIIAQVSHFRMVKSDNPNRFMVLMKFHSNEAARSFQDVYNGKPFNSMESELCHVIFVKSVLFKPLNRSNVTGIPYLLEDPFTLQVKKSNNLEKSGGALGSGSVVKELPTCPVCLERMDSDITGLVTISCQHTFHCNCLSKWRDDTCPVCRYSNLSLDRLRRSDSREALQHCTDCGGTQNLWICLVCGNIGCGRYNSKHAIEHYETTMHCFSMDIATQRVWDYAGDNYVHRLLQNETDGKLVELPAASSCSSSEFGVNISSSSDDLKDKNRDYSIEYSNVLLSQLESQREYYESRLAESADLASNAIAESNEKDQRLEKLEDQFKQLSLTVGKLQDSSIGEERVKEVKVVKNLARTFEKKWKEEQALAENLSFNLEKLRSENEDIKRKNEDLQEEVNDLMTHLMSQERFRDAPEDMKNGTIVIQPRPQSTRPSKSKKQR